MIEKEICPQILSVGISNFNSITGLSVINDDQMGIMEEAATNISMRIFM